MVILNIFVFALDSGEMNSGDENTHSDKNKKRTIKTRAQIEALEKFYDGKLFLLIMLCIGVFYHPILIVLQRIINKNVLLFQNTNILQS